MIHRTPFFLPWLYPSLIWRMPAEGKYLYLTFDDGPVPGPTEFVLDTLQHYGGHATFFCIGENIKKHPEVLKKIMDAGHTIGNHTYNHLNGWKTSTDDYKLNVNRCEEQIEKHRLTGEKTNLFRPPYGRITRDQIKVLTEFKIIMWDVLSMDYNINLVSEKCLKNTIHVCHPGSIIIFHDSYKAEKNLTFVLPRLMEHYTDLGFTFKAIV